MNNPQSVLLIEDEGAVSLILGKEFESKGYKVLKASNGKEGLDTALKEHPDVILADLKMPVMGGLEMVKELRKDDWGKRAKVIILTNVSDLDMVQEAVEMETLHYLVKGDLGMEEIIERVEKLLNTNASEDTAKE